MLELVRISMNIINTYICNNQLFILCNKMLIYVNKSVQSLDIYFM